MRKSQKKTDRKDACFVTTVLYRMYMGARTANSKLTAAERKRENKQKKKKRSNKSCPSTNAAGTKQQVLVTFLHQR